MRINILAIALLIGAAAFASTPQRLSPRAAITAQRACAAAAPRTISAYITVTPDCDRTALEALGAKISLDLGTILTVRMPIDALASISALDGVRYVETATQARQMLDVATSETGMTNVHQGADERQPYTGAGVIIGVIDNGFDYGHAAFRDSDGSLRISRVWEQGTTPAAGMRSPERFGYGVELVTPEAIIDAGGDIRNNSHGTHVASIAAGSDKAFDGALMGMAPDAEIVLVSMIDAGIANVNISDAIAYIFDYADEAGKPCVINLSLGEQSGPHDGTSSFDVIADALQGPGHLIVGASGNHRASESLFHLRREFGGADDDALRTFVDYRQSLSQHTPGGDIEIWSTADVEVALNVVKLSSSQVSDRTVIYPSDDASEVSLGRNVTGTFTVASETSVLNGKRHVVLSSAVTSIRTGYAIAIEVTPKGSGVVDIWADDLVLGLTDRGIAGYSAPTTESTICEIGGTAKRILSVGAYTTRNQYVALGATSTTKLTETVGDRSSFSNYGPTADGRLKPQVTTPGCIISAAVSGNDNSGTIIPSRYHNDGVRDHLYGYMQGTSMSSPMMAGIVATWLQAYPELTPEVLADIVAKTCRTDDFTGATPNDKWGYGKVDALAGLMECISREAEGINSVNGDRKAPIIYNVGGDVTVTFTADAPYAVIEAYNMQGSLLDRHHLTDVRAAQTASLKFPAGYTIIRVTLPRQVVVTKALSR